MVRKVFKPEQIIYMLREAEVKLADGEAFAYSITSVMGRSKSVESGLPW